MRGRPVGHTCTPKCAQILAEHTVKSLGDLSRELGISSSGVDYVLRKHGLRKKRAHSEAFKRKIANPLRVRRLRQDYSLKYASMIKAYLDSPKATLDSVGKQFGVTRERVRQILSRSGVTVRHGHYHSCEDSKCGEVAELYNGGYTTKGIAKALDKTYNEVCAIIMRHNIRRVRVPNDHSEHFRRFCSDRCFKMIELYNAGYSTVAITRIFNLSMPGAINSVNKILKYHGVQIRQLGRNRA